MFRHQAIGASFEFLRQSIARLNVSASEVNVAVATFSDEAHTDFAFNSSYNASEINDYFTYPEIDQSTFQFVPGTGNMHWRMSPPGGRFDVSNLQVRTTRRCCQRCINYKVIK